MSRVRLLIAAVVAVVLSLLAGCGGPAAVPPPSRNVGTRLDGAVPDTITHLPLVDATGHTRHLSDFAGKVVVVSDMMTLCQESCPLDTAALVQTARAVDAAGDASRVEFLSVTIDPTRDTVPQIKAYRRLYGGPSNWLVLTGSKDDVQQLWSYLGVYRKTVPADSPAPKNWRTGAPLHYDIQHSDETFFFDGRGHERFILEGVPHLSKPGEVPSTIDHFLSDEGRKNLAHPGPLAWTEPQALGVMSWLLDQRITTPSG